MDFYNELAKFDEKTPLRQKQEIYRYSGKPDNQKHPYRNTARKNVGEYYPLMKDRIKVFFLNKSF